MDLIIKIRLDALRNNLIKLQSILEFVKDRRAEIETLSTDLGHANQLVLRAKYDLAYVLHTARNKLSSAKMDPSLAEFLDTTQARVDTLDEVISNAMKRIEAIQKRWVPIDKTFETTFKKDLNETMRPWYDTINEHLESLDNAKPEELDQLREEAWREYTDIISEKNRLIFSEYFEFLGGLALRDAGLDEGICRIADELMRSCGSVITEWSALTIPASREAATLARSIRMRFPEWTIWAVPLTAHELGQVVIREPGSPDLEKFVRSEFPKAQKKQQHMRVLLADAFATYVMGPAYACSVILLRFNPRAAEQDKSIYPPDAKRAYVVLSMLRKMYEKHPLANPPYGDILEKLQIAWDSACVKGQGRSNAIADSQRLLDRWTNQVLEELDRAYATGLYEGRLWESTQEALELVLRGGEPAAKLKGAEEWRDVLNAAWAYRLNHSDESQDIAKSAEVLWKQIKQKRDIRERRVSQMGVASFIPHIRADKKYGQQ
jgi:hypothetical protein